MLASETEEISNFLKQFIINKKGLENYKDFFADTRDTLCYATNGVTKKQPMVYWKCQLTWLLL